MVGHQSLGVCWQ